MSWQSGNPAPRKTQGIRGRATSRRVFPNAQVAHVWAQQKQEDGRSGNGNFYFHGTTIYSYRDSWPLATFTTHEQNGKRVVLVNSDSYSVSTSGHLSDVRGALRGLDVVTIETTRESLESFTRAGSYWSDDKERQEACAVAIVQEKIDALSDTAKSLSNPRKRSEYVWAENKSGADAHLDATYAELKAGAWRKAAEIRAASLSDSYILETAAALGVTPPDYDLEALRRKIVAEFELYFAPDKLAKREKSALKREKTAPVDAFVKHMRKLETGEHIPWRSRNNLESILRGIAANRPDYLETALARVNVWRLTLEQNELFGKLNPDAEEIIWQRKYGDKGNRITPEQWLAGARGSFYSEAPTLLRRVGDRLETSRGAEAPFKQAVAIFTKAQACRATGKTFAPNGERYHAGHFELDSIDENGNIRIGCHRIEFHEMQRLAIQQVSNLVAPRFPLPAIV